MLSRGFAGTPADAKPWDIWVKKAGDAHFVMIKTTAGNISELLDAVIIKLPSLASKDPSTLSLFVASDKDGLTLGAALDTRATLEAAGVVAGASIVVQEAETPAAAQLRGACMCGEAYP